MKQIKIKGIEEVVYYEKLDNNLDVYIVSKTNRNSISISMTTKYGSKDLEFIPKGSTKFYKSPRGVAHFLEHKVFDTPNSKDIMDLFSKNGIMANAYTSSFQTTYHFNCVKDVEENVNALLDLVQSASFTDKLVEKEKGIIEQEIKGGDDEPDFYLDMKLRENLLLKHPFKYTVAGTVEDIKEITKEDLDKCYQTFYSPNNMFLIIVGNVDPEKIINSIKENQSKKQFDNPEIKVKNIKEPLKVEKEYEELRMAIEIPKFYLGIKIKEEENLNVENKIKREIYYRMFLALSFGLTSKFHEKMLENNYISYTIDATYINVDSFSTFFFSNESNEPKKVIEEIKNILKNIDIKEDDVERYKKITKSNFIATFDNVDYIEDYLNYMNVYYGDIAPNYIDIIDSITYKEFKKCIQKIDFSISSEIIAFPKE